MSKSKKLKVPALDPNLTKADIETLIAEIGRAQVSAQRLVAAADARKASIETGLSQDLAPIEASIKAKFAIVAAWAERHRGDICPDGSKTASLATGRIAWRFDPKSVKLTDVPAVLAALKAGGLARFIRTSEDVDKQAILKEEAAVADIAGIAIVQAEQIYVTPNQTNIDPIELSRKVAA